MKSHWPFRVGNEAPDGCSYIYHDAAIELAVNVALVTHRPLLITGSPGVGKSTLAIDIAKRQGWSYLEESITSRTSLERLVYSVDHVRRLSDAHAGRQDVNIRDINQYVEPGSLWWAFAQSKGEEPYLGQGRYVGGMSQLARDSLELSDDYQGGAVLLIDEIDKADPDLPNDLLRPLDIGELVGPDGERITAERQRLLIVITSNRERALPAAFVRRCVSLDLETATVGSLVRIATRHHGEREDSLYNDVARCLINIGESLGGEIQPPAVAEFLDAVRASIELSEFPSGEVDQDATPGWKIIEELLLRKSAVR